MFFFFSDCLDERTVRRLFVFLKKKLIFNTLQDEFIKRNFFADNKSKDYVFGKTDEYYRCERFLKLIIKKKICKEFIACMHELPSYRKVFERILEFQNSERKKSTILNGTCEKETVMFLFSLPSDFSLMLEYILKQYFLLFCSW